jgi:hypothetical protein
VLSNTPKAIERYATVIVALLTVLTAALGVLSAYFGVKASTATQRRDEVKTQASGLESDLSSLQVQVTGLKRENARLRAAASATPDGAGSAGNADDAETRNLTVPLAENGSMYIDLDKGEVSNTCCEGFEYVAQSPTGRPQLQSSHVTYSTDVPSAAISRDECSDAVTQRPQVAPVRHLEVGTLICATSAGGTSLLEITQAPNEDGSFKLRQTFWAAG